jgi:hypothetical protein
MKYVMLMFAAASLLGCPGPEPKPEPPPDVSWHPPLVDPNRIEDVCPAPEVDITTGGCVGYDEVTRQCISWPTKPAGELVLGDRLYYPFSWPNYTVVSAVEIVDGQQRLQLSMTDGRALTLSPNHVMKLQTSNLSADCVPLPEGVDPGGDTYVQVQYLIPGVCLDGDVRGVVQDLQVAADGPVVRISIEGGTAFMYVTEGLYSRAHNGTQL